MDNNMLMIIGNWLNNLVEGSAMIIFPEGITFYGNFVKGRPS